ncbi:hypothetical protein HNQ08_001837 [Deinococcus humi]|uniref:Uncharacterized protein n=1 Tax=Deinococcus humi TaxID=662880 RepID=A0A7W8JT30_9DEIO|nr:hypothetical protein [Deinococcus humi]GGO30882.1 hypothetical protein GCM10008949_26050 [Deinococcus humi]
MEITKKIQDALAETLWATLIAAQSKGSMNRSISVQLLHATRNGPGHHVLGLKKSLEDCDERLSKDGSSNQACVVNRDFAEPDDHARGQHDRGDLAAHHSQKLTWNCESITQPLPL